MPPRFCLKVGISKSSRIDFVHLSGFWIFRHFQWAFFMAMLPRPQMLKQNLAGFIWGNQVIRLPRVTVVIISLHVQAKNRQHSAKFQKHKIEPKHVYIRLEMLSSRYLSVKSINFFSATNSVNIARQMYFCRRRFLPRSAHGLPAGVNKLMSRRRDLKWTWKSRKALEGHIQTLEWDLIKIKLYIAKNKCNVV